MKKLVNAYLRHFQNLQTVYKIFTPVLLVTNQTCAETSKLPGYYDQVCTCSTLRSATPGCFK